MTEPKTTEQLLSVARDDVFFNTPQPYKTRYTADCVMGLQELDPQLDGHLKAIEKLVESEGQKIGFEIGEWSRFNKDKVTALAFAMGDPTNDYSRKLLIEIIRAPNGFGFRNDYATRLVNTGSILESEFSTANNVDDVVKRVAYFLVEERYLPPRRENVAAASPQPVSTELNQG